MHRASSTIRDCGSDQVYLRPEAKIEPLACGWYAWTHMICPVQRAMNMAFRHIPLLKSFIQTPAVHIAASRDPSLFGGPFVDLPITAVPAVAALLDETRAKGARLLSLAKTLKDLDIELQAKGKGASLNEFYDRLAPELAGLVEFLYDLNNHPRLRLYEELIYDEYFDPQSYEVMLSILKDRDRTFFMSTPRLPNESAFVFEMPLTDARVDRLAMARSQADSFLELSQELHVPAQRLSDFRMLFTEDQPRRDAPEYVGNGVRVRYFGHACILIQTDKHSILLDPLFAWESDGDDRFTFADLPDRIDTVVISHGHQDHCVPEVLMQLRHRIGRVVVPANNSGSIADPSIKLLLQHLGIGNVEVVTALTNVLFPDGVITSLPFPGEHVDLEIYSRHGILIEVKGRRLAFLVDSEGCDPMLFRRISRRIGGKVDALFLGMECNGAPLTWLYGPLMTKSISRRDDESRRLSSLDSRRAQRALAELAPDQVYVYAMGQEPWLRHMLGLEYTPESIQLKEVAAFLEHCRTHGVPAKNLRIRHEFEWCEDEAARCTA